jgi:two-component sensor histidine kinase
MDAWLPPVAESVRRARHSARDSCSWLDPDTRLHLDLIVSELVANAVVHARTPLHVEVSSDESSIRVEVADGSDDEPVPGGSPGLPGGLGLKMVDRVASAWGSTVAPGARGKTVWARLDVGRPPRGRV